MGRIDDSLKALEKIENGTERAFQLSGLISTLFKIKGVMLVVTGQLAFDIYSNSTTPRPELEFETFSGKLTPRMLQEIMGEQLGGRGMMHRWKVAGVPVRFEGEIATSLPDLCRDFMTDHGVAKLFPAEEITAQRILAAVYPKHDDEAFTQARLLLINALSEAFQMDWAALQNLCHQPDYRIGEDLAKMRASAKRDVDSLGLTPDPLASAPTPTPAPDAAVSPQPAAVSLAPTPGFVATPLAPPPLPTGSPSAATPKKSSLMSEDLTSLY
jgi:hypothetical protein